MLIKLRPTEKYFEWACSLEKGKDIEVPDPETFCNAYLVKETITGERTEVRKVLAKHWKKIAREEFESWWMLEEDWPKVKNIKEFEEYFSWSFTELVFDLEKEPLERENEDDLLW